jgi:hypothetical protein
VTGRRCTNADLLAPRAGLPTPDPTRTAHLEALIAEYLQHDGYTRFSAEQISLAAFNPQRHMDGIGDYVASPHLQGELRVATTCIEAFVSGPATINTGRSHRSFGPGIPDCAQVNAPICSRTFRYPSASRVIAKPTLGGCTTSIHGQMRHELTMKLLRRTAVRSSSRQDPDS